MRSLVQRVTEASVSVVADGEEEVVGTVGPGLVALIGVTHEDSEDEARRLAGKIANLRVFDDKNGVMNLSARDVGGDVLVVSQFTLYGDTRKGRRPSYIEAAPPEVAEPLVDEVAAALGRLGITVAAGRFRTHMRVRLVNDGPVTLLLDV